jgi:hypothetical protein
MKFYRDKNNECYYWDKIIDNKLTVIYYDSYSNWFFEKGNQHNLKNAAFIRNNGCKVFRLNGYSYGNRDNFTKQS